MKKALLSLLFAGLLSGCEKRYYVLDSTPTMRYEHLTVADADGKELRAVDFVSSTEGYVGGQGGLVLFTADGGKSWQPRSIAGLSSTANVNCLLFSSPLIGLAGTSRGIFRTTNGGQTWQQLDNSSVYDLQMVTPQVGYAVGERTILKTTNGGLYWNDRSPSYFPGGTLLRAVSFSSLDSGMIVGNGLTRLHTNNGGQTWLFDGGSWSDNTHYYDVLRRRNGSCLVVGDPTSGVSRQGFNEEANPQSMGTGPQPYGLFSVCGLARWQNREVAVGYNCVVRRDPFASGPDAGWVYVQGPDGATIRRVYLAADFADADTFYAVGREGTITRFHY